MRSALLITVDYPPQRGGVAVYLSRLVERFPVGKIQVLAQTNKDRAAHEMDMNSPAPIYRRRLLRRWLKPGWLPALYWADWVCRKEGDPSVLIVSHLLPLGEVAYWLNRRRGIPYVVILHGMDAALALSSGRRKRANATRILARAALVAANSEQTARLAETFGVPKDKIVIVRPSPEFPLNYTVPAARTEAVRARYGLDGYFSVLSVGRLVARKNFDVVVRAAAELKRQGVKIKLIIAGDGPERAALAKLAQDLGAGDDVAFAGAVPDDELAALYSACDVMAMAPKSRGADVEGFGIVYLEAALFGKPAVGSRAGGVPEAVLHEKTGLLVEPGDVQGTAAALKRLADDPGLRQRLGQAGRQRVLEEFGWPRQARIFMAALDEIARDK